MTHVDLIEKLQEYNPMASSLLNISNVEKAHLCASHPWRNLEIGQTWPQVMSSSRFMQSITCLFPHSIFSPSFSLFFFPLKKLLDVSVLAHRH